MRPFSLRKAKKILFHTYHLYWRKKGKLTSGQADQVVTTLKRLEEAVVAKDLPQANKFSQESISLTQTHLAKGNFEKFRDMIGGLLIALVIALLIRTMWFELYEIPSGSMRPTLKEQDRLIVSKTDFGINIPMSPSHFLFKPDLVKRSEIFVFTGENMDIHDVDTLYFYLFPGKKQYVKRMLGKPGDTLYFYGGELYGIDQDGNDITPQLQYSTLKSIDHIPFIYFEGKVITPSHPGQGGVYSPVTLYQMNEPVARLSFANHNQLRGELIISSSKQPPPENYGELWGFRNYAMARLLTKSQVQNLLNVEPQSIGAMGDALLYLELRHSPSLSNLQLIRDELGRVRPALSLSSSLIPLGEAQLQELFTNLYTARFVIDKGRLHRYGMSKTQAEKHPFLPELPGVPNGCFEFYHGKAYQIYWQGVTKELPPSHPLYQFTPERLQLLFNVGIECDMRYAPQVKDQRLFPARFAYFRQGDLYVMGAPLLKKGDPLLVNFLNREEGKVKQPSYRPFKDYGPPLTADGSLDRPFIERYGLKIPPKGYLGLGDNHAMSADSRDFGFVPEDNIRGAPDFIFWPPGSRWGKPNQPPVALLTEPRLIVWALVLLCFLGWWLYVRGRNRLPLKY